MSWLLASFAIVFAVLAGGWVAYERRRPSARMVAVVATMAAVAALGRDAFVALPDVKPITAIAFVVGYALGPLPGFTVGAIGMLASNVMLGQGPYTPWQMAAWGLVGLAGAGLARLSSRELSRLTLALACALAALCAKEIMNLYTWTIGASHTPAAFAVIAGGALPFDLTDMVATLLFALAFGPELARLLGRTRERMNVTWENASSGAAVGLAVLVVAVGAGAAPARAQAASLSPEISFLLSAAERRRRLRRRTRAALQRAVHGLGRNGPGGGRPRPGRRDPRSPFGAQLAARRSLDAERPRRCRAHDPRGPRVRRVGLLVRRAQSGGRSAARALAR